MILSHTVPYTDTLVYAAPPSITRMPLECDSQQGKTVQFIWRVGEDEVFDSMAIEEKLHGIAEEVNFIFWRDRDSDTLLRVPAWKMTAGCRLHISFLVDPPIEAIPDTKAIIIEDTAAYCGKGQLSEDDKPDASNKNNDDGLAWISRHCLGYYVVIHELLHMMGAVQKTAPNSDGSFHATDFGDLMSKPFDPIQCPDADHLDCGNDDYYALDPAPGSYLDTHWNAANSVFLRNVAIYTTILPLFRNSAP